LRRPSATFYHGNQIWMRMTFQQAPKIKLPPR